MKRFNEFRKTDEFDNLLASIFAIIFGLIFGFIIILATNPKNAIDAFGIILQGGFYHGIFGLGNVLFSATPIILTGLSVGFAFKTGLFNIGASGQFMIGAFTAIYVGVNWTWLPPSIAWLVAMLAGAFAGAIWGMIVGALKAYRNVNEVIASIMMNYIAMYLVNFWMRISTFDQVYSRTIQPKNAYLPRMGLDVIFPKSSINIGIVIAIVVAIVIHIILNKTTFGFELKAVGYNRHSSKYAGINEKKSIILSMAIAGMLAGLGGALLYLSDVGVYLNASYSILKEGFDGISVALLAQSNPIAIIFSGIFISHITYGGSNLQLLNLQPEIIEVITAAIIYISALSILLKKFIGKFKKKDKEVQ